MNLVIASANEGKVKEFKTLLHGVFKNVWSLNDFSKLFPHLPLLNSLPEETGTTFSQNAYDKAAFVHRKLNSNLIYGEHCEPEKVSADKSCASLSGHSNTLKTIPFVLADDSGLCVDALNGAPGIFSARYAGEGASSKDCRKKLLQELGDEKNRKAKFVCALCLICPDGKTIFAEGETFGEITDASFDGVGENGFGYDCLFMSEDLKTTFSLASNEQKNAVSHRRRAFDALVKQLSY